MVRHSFERRKPQPRQQLNTRISAALADRLYYSLEEHAPHVTTAQAVTEALELWLARRDLQTLEHIQPSSEEEIMHAQPE